ncbi:MAG: hypothetical protein HZB99_03680 [Candidatus Harrisonbacteria bacterium]|nr:hypothetical protein [Candidatus Harrisonbacteria bacterium]
MPIYSSKHCDLCGGEGEGFRCPKCGEAASVFDPAHWQKCKDGAMMQVRCKKCKEAESNCKCK